MTPDLAHHSILRSCLCRQQYKFHIVQYCSRRLALVGQPYSIERTLLVSKKNTRTPCTRSTPSSTLIKKHNEEYFRNLDRLVKQTTHQHSSVDSNAFKKMTKPTIIKRKDAENAPIFLRSKLVSNIHDSPSSRERLVIYAFRKILRTTNIGAPSSGYEGQPEPHHRSNDMDSDHH